MYLVGTSMLWKSFPVLRHGDPRRLQSQVIRLLPAVAELAVAFKSLASGSWPQSLLLIYAVHHTGLQHCAAEVLREQRTRDSGVHSRLDDVLSPERACVFVG